MYHMLFNPKDGRDDRVVYHACLDQQFRTAGLAMLLLVPACVITTAPLVVMALVQAAFLGALAFLAGVIYGMLNDMLACRSNLEYFTYGHQFGQAGGLVKCLDKPSVHAVAWGFYATYPLALIAGAVFGVTACVSTLLGISLLSSNLFMIPVGILVVCLVADGVSRYMTARHRTTLLERPRPHRASFEPEAEQEQAWCATWYANSNRNLFGYIALPALAVLMLAAIITLSALHVSVSLPLISALSVQCQMIVLAAPFVLLMSVGLTYFFIEMNCLKRDKARIHNWKDKMGIGGFESSTSQRNTSYSHA